MVEGWQGKHRWQWHAQPTQSSKYATQRLPVPLGLLFLLCQHQASLFRFPTLKTGPAENSPLLWLLLLLLCLNFLTGWLAGWLGAALRNGGGGGGGALRLARTRETVEGNHVSYAERNDTPSTDFTTTTWPPLPHPSTHHHHLHLHRLLPSRLV